MFPFDSQVRALKAGERRQSKSVGDSLILVIESVARGGGKSFEGRMRFNLVNDIRHGQF